MGVPGTCFAAHGSKLFLATYGEGVYRSLDSGATWNRVNVGLADTNVNTIYLFGSYLYAGTDGGGVYRSVNDGTSWQLMSTGLADGNGKRVMSIAGITGTIVAGTRTGAYYSTDSGVTWTLATSGLTSSAVPTLYGIGIYLFGGTYSGGVFRSTDGGVNWSSSTSGWPSGNVRAFCVVGDWIYGGNYGGDVIYRSTNKGSSWTASGRGITSLNTYSMTAANGRVYVGAVNGVWRTTDHGATWTQAAAPLLGRATYSMLSKSGYVFAGTSGDGPYRSTDNGDSWAAANTGLPSGSARAVAGMAADTNWTYCATFAGMYRSSDNGGSWSAAKTGITDSVMESVCAWNGLVLAGAQSHMYRSTNSGASWTAIASGLPSAPVYSIVRSDSVFFAAFYLGSNPSVYRSTDRGVTWEPRVQRCSRFDAGDPASVLVRPQRLWRCRRGRDLGHDQQGRNLDRCQHRSHRASVACQSFHRKRRLRVQRGHEGGRLAASVIAHGERRPPRGHWRHHEHVHARTELPEPFQPVHGHCLPRARHRGADHHVAGVRSARQGGGNPCERTAGAGKTYGNV